MKPGIVNKRRIGFTLMELMVGSAILVAALLGVLGVFINCMGMNETVRNLTIAINRAQQELEEIRNLFNTGVPPPAGHYSDNLPVLPNLVYQVAVDIIDDGTDPEEISSDDLFWINISVSWQQKGGRVIGEDKNLNGNIDAGEDVNLNGILDSSAQLTTLLTTR